MLNGRKLKSLSLINLTLAKMGEWTLLRELVNEEIVH